MSSSTAKTVASSALKPATELARASDVRFPNESVEYRRAREALLAEEIELRRHIERVAEQRMHDLFEAMNVVLRTHPEVGEYNQKI